MELKICLDDALLKMDHKTLLIEREKGFLSMGTSQWEGNRGIVKSIVIHCRNSPEKSQPSGFKEGKKNSYALKENNILEPAIILQGQFNMENTVNLTVDSASAILIPNEGNDLSMNAIFILKDKLDNKTLIDLFKAVVESKTAALWDLGVINHFSLDPFASGNSDSILIASTGSGSFKTPEEMDEFRSLVEQCVRNATVQVLRNYGYPKDVMGFMADAGVKVEDLVEAGMELCVGVERSEALNIKLRNQILKSLEDLNVVSLIMAGIRLEEDYAKHRVRGVDVDQDPAYLYSDEVLGMAIANQIAGTKAIFNFKRYDEIKPGIIAALGPVLDDVFAGLVAGCMSRIFEE